MESEPTLPDFLKLAGGVTDWFRKMDYGLEELGEPFVGEEELRSEDPELRIYWKSE